MTDIFGDVSRLMNLLERLNDGVGLDQSADPMTNEERTWVIELLADMARVRTTNEILRREVKYAKDAGWLR